MTDLQLTIEPDSQELHQAYRAAALDRAQDDAIAWSFASNPKPFAVARASGEIVGMSAYIRTRMKLGSAEGSGFQAVDSFVSETMRGQGVFTKLARSYDAHVGTNGGDLIWGFPNDNAAPAWFGKLAWSKFGQVPVLIKPLRAGYFLRRLGLPLDFPLSLARDQNLPEETAVGHWGDELWARSAANISCATIRDKAYFSHRIFGAPHRPSYRVVASTHASDPAIVVTRETEKHGGRIAYLMEALGGPSLHELLTSEMGRLRGRGTEVVLAWAFPWSPNYDVLRKVGFVPLPARIRPIRIWFGARPKSADGLCAGLRNSWYLSYLDSDTI